MALTLVQECGRRAARDPQVAAFIVHFCFNIFNIYRVTFLYWHWTYTVLLSPYLSCLTGVSSCPRLVIIQIMR